ncbi:Txe/YoeB family addiction module toxin [Solibaculum intestinale]|uniref:Endoribonuclease YoeB n=1 Tax=Solibaculum intestinale TaxID=3133165 RepID=A0ABV1E4R2_9FIRM
MVVYKIVYTKTAVKQIPLLKSAKLDERVKKLIDVLKQSPFQNPPPYEKLVGDMAGAYSRRINVQHRLVYQVYEPEQTVKIISMWSHYEY